MVLYHLGLAYCGNFCICGLYTCGHQLPYCHGDRALGVGSWSS